MTRGLILLLLVLLAALAPTPAMAEPSGEKISGPMVITSATLSADAGSHTAVFEGSVLARTDDISLHSDRMTVYYDEAGGVLKIEVEGGVKLIKGERVLTSTHATYLAREQKILFKGEPMAVEGNNIITGSEITYLIDDDRTIVKDSRVIIKQINGN